VLSSLGQINQTRRGISSALFTSGKFGEDPVQVVFVHGVNTRDLGDGDYDRWVNGRTDRMNRLAFGGRAEIRNPYWGKYGLQTKVLKSIPAAKGVSSPLGLQRGLTNSNDLLSLAKRDFRAAVASMSVSAISQATALLDADERHHVEDIWLAKAASADAGYVPDWLPTVKSDAELLDRLTRVDKDELKLEAILQPAKPMGMDWKPKAASFDTHAFLATRARELMAGHLAQFLGDALMFFSRREQSLAVRQLICASIVEAAKSARDKGQPLVLIGYSMGGGVLHEVLTDRDAVEEMEGQLGGALEVDLFLSVGTQIGLFAELRQFSEVPMGAPLRVPVSQYWNIFDYNDTLAFLCAPLLATALDFEISTGAGLSDAHGSYFENALFFSRLSGRLKAVGLAGD
jgi:hypothetical protein